MRRKKTAGSVNVSSTAPWDHLEGDIEICYVNDNDDDRISHVVVDWKPKRGETKRTVILASDLLGISSVPDSTKGTVYFKSNIAENVMEAQVADIYADDCIKYLSDRIEFDDKMSGNRMVVMSTESSAFTMVDINGIVRPS